MDSGFRALLALVLLGALSACEPQTGDESSASLDAADAGTEIGAISWFDGTVDEAFAAARIQGKPVFLYWGAEWCPPCHAIAATVFRSREFIERSKLFIPVYLDGDQENAQAAGEHFGVVGYPTMIVFSAEGSELTRIPGGIDIQAYANVLDLSIASSGSVANLLAQFLAEDRSLPAADCQRLTYYSWGQDPQILADRIPHEVFRKLYDACPTTMRVERSILFADYLDRLVDAVNDEESGLTLDGKQADEAIEKYLEIVDNPVLSRANVFAVIFSSGKIIAAISESDTGQRNDLVTRVRSSLDRLAADEAVYKRERIYTAIGKIELERIDDPEAELSQELRDEIVALVEWADQSTPDVYERQPIINAASGLLDEAGMPEIAKALLLAELNRSKQPYYYMISLADIEQSAGNFDAALDWLRRAYDSSKGPATRFQWGYYYVAGLIEMTPEDRLRIHKTTVDVIAELEGGAGFHQRPKAQLKRLESKLMEWGDEEGRTEALRSIRDDVLTVCARFEDQGESTSTCRSFLDAA